MKHHNARASPPKCLWVGKKIRFELSQKLDSGWSIKGKALRDTLSIEYVYKFRWMDFFFSFQKLFSDFSKKSFFLAASRYKKSWIWVTVCSCKLKWIEEIWKRMTLELSKTSTVKEIRNFLKFYFSNFFSEKGWNRKRVFTFSKRCTFLQILGPLMLGLS